MKVSWVYYSEDMENHKIHVPNHQPVNPLDFAVTTIVFGQNKSSSLVSRDPDELCEKMHKRAHVLMLTI